MSSTEFGPGCDPLVGEVHLPGDKSLSHRAVLFAAMAEGTTELTGVLDSADVRSTIGAVASSAPTSTWSRTRTARWRDGRGAGARSGPASTARASTAATAARPRAC